jgi:hypothetical protein
MIDVTLTAIPRDNGCQATVNYPDGTSVSSAETYASIAEAITAAALKLLDMPFLLEARDAPDDLAER